MGIFSRTRDIVAANMAELLDRADDPAKMIRMIILEMEETLVEVRASAARTIADQKEIRRHIGKLANLEANWEEKAELAMSKGREDLAKAALIERQKANDMADRLRAEVAVLDDALRAAEEDIGNLQTKLRDARSRQNAIQQRITTANTRIKAREAWSGERAQDAFSRFEVLERRADFAEGRADAMRMGTPPKSLEEELADVHADDKIEAAMAALRARTQNKGGE
jgi:phage shock protein A